MARAFLASCSCGLQQQVAAALVDAQLAPHLQQRGLRLLLKQRREQEQREVRVPSQRGGVVGRAAQGGVLRRQSGLLQELPEQAALEPFQGGRFDGPERNRV